MTTSTEQSRPKRRRLLLAGQGPLAYEAMRYCLSRDNEDLELVGFYPWFAVRKAQSAGWFRAEIIEDKAMLRLVKKHRLTLFKDPGGLNHKAFLQELKSKYQVDTILIASWGEKVADSSLNCAETAFTWLNIHPSLLPYHRGPNPYISAIRFGETEAGVTLHLLDSGWDTGPLLHQEKIVVQPFETGGSLRSSCRLLVSSLLKQGFEQLNQGIALEQEGGGSYYSAQLVNQHEIDWALDPERLERWHRAVQPWFFLTTTSDQGHSVLVEKMKVVVYRIDENPAWPNAGTVLKVNPRGLYVASSKSGIAILLEGYRLGEPLGWWYPAKLSSWLLSCLLKPSSYFFNSSL